MAEHVVIEHHLDKAAEVYRVVVGIPITGDVPTGDVDEETGEPMTAEQIVGFDAVEDFVFAAADERWRDDRGRELPPDVLAEAQRDLIREALAERQAAAAAAAVSQPLSMPGVGDAL